MIAAIESAETVVASGDTLHLVLGDMLELGDHGPEAHRQVLRRALDSGAQRIVLVGDAFAYAAATSDDRRIVLCADAARAAEVVADLPTGGTVLVKASLGTALGPLVPLLAQGAREAERA